MNMMQNKHSLSCLDRTLWSFPCCTPCWKRKSNGQLPGPLTPSTSWTRMATSRKILRSCHLLQVKHSPQFVDHSLAKHLNNHVNPVCAAYSVSLTDPLDREESLCWWVSGSYGALHLHSVAAAAFHLILLRGPGQYKPRPRVQQLRQCASQVQDHRHATVKRGAPLRASINHPESFTTYYCHTDTYCAVNICRYLCWYNWLRTVRYDISSSWILNGVVFSFLFVQMFSVLGACTDCSHALLHNKIKLNNSKYIYFIYCLYYLEISRFT